MTKRDREAEAAMLRALIIKRLRAMLAADEAYQRIIDEAFDLRAADEGEEEDHGD